MVREATAEDYPIFIILWVKFLRDQIRIGGDVAITPRTIQFFSALFMAYVTGARRGVTLLDDEAAVSMWGEDLVDPIIECVHTPSARGWGTYVEEDSRRKGIGNRLRSLGMQKMKEIGFKYATGGVLVTNEVSISSLRTYKPETPQIVYLKNLEEL